MTRVKKITVLLIVVLMNIPECLDRVDLAQLVIELKKTSIGHKAKEGQNALDYSCYNKQFLVVTTHTCSNQCMQYNIIITAHSFSQIPAHSERR